jgi:hypothetical protein
VKTGFEAGEEPLDCVARIQAPLLVIHGEADRVIPVDCGRKIHAASASPKKRFLSVPKADHNDLDLYEGADHETFVRYLDSTLPRR